MTLNSQTHKKTSTAFAILAVTAMLFSEPVLSKSLPAPLEDQITSANAAKIQKYIDKAFLKIEESERPVYMDMLVARLHVCALVNKLLSETSRKSRIKTTSYRFRHGTFNKLITFMSEGYPKQKTDSLAAKAKTFIKKKLTGGDNAKLQITLNSCTDIHAGKITHALSNMGKPQPPAAPGGLGMAITSKQ